MLTYRSISFGVLLLSLIRSSSLAQFAFQGEHHHHNGCCAPFPWWQFTPVGLGFDAGPIPVMNLQQPPMMMMMGPMRMEIPPAGPPQPVRVGSRQDSAKADRLVKLGDNLFRAGNLPRAVERYRQAEKAAGNLALPHLRLAQVAFLKQDYKLAADRLREAITAQGGWLATTPNIVGLYGEPSTFHEAMTLLETHLQATPNDREAWFVLGFQLYASGETQKASDVFLRLSDRKNDLSLNALLKVTHE